MATATFKVTDYPSLAETLVTMVTSSSDTILLSLLSRSLGYHGERIFS